MDENGSLIGKVSAVGALSGSVSPGQIGGGGGGEDQLAKLATTAGSSADNPVSVDLKTGGSEILGIGAYFRNSGSADSAATPSSSSLSGITPRFCKIKLQKETTKIDDDAFACMIGLTEIEADLDNPVDIGARSFYCCPNLKTVGNLWNKLKTCKANSFATRNGGNVSFELNRDIVAPEFEGIVNDGTGTFAFNRCGFKSFTAPKCRGLGVSNAFSNCTNMVFADFTVLESIPGRTFYNCSVLTDLWLRGDYVVPVANDAFMNIPAVSSDSSAFTLHVKAELVDAYKADSTWSTYVRRGINVVAI